MNQWQPIDSQEIQFNNAGGPQTPLWVNNTNGILHNCCQFKIEQASLTYDEMSSCLRITSKRPWPVLLRTFINMLFPVTSCRFAIEKFQVLVEYTGSLIISASFFAFKPFFKHGEFWSLFLNSLFIVVAHVKTNSLYVYASLTNTDSNWAILSLYIGSFSS